MKTEDEAEAFMKPTYYRSSLLILNQKSIIIRSMKRLIEQHFANDQWSVSMKMSKYTYGFSLASEWAVMTFNDINKERIVY